MLHLPTALLNPLIAVLILIGVDVLAGILVAVSKATFNLSKVGSFIVSSILPYVGGIVLLGVLAVSNSGLQGAYLAAVAAASVKFLGDIYSKLSSLGVSAPPPTDTAPKA